MLIPSDSPNTPLTLQPQAHRASDEAQFLELFGSLKMALMCSPDMCEYRLVHFY